MPRALPGFLLKDKRLSSADEITCHGIVPAADHQIVWVILEELMSQIYWMYAGTRYFRAGRCTAIRMNRQNGNRLPRSSMFRTFMCCLPHARNNFCVAYYGGRSSWRENPSLEYMSEAIIHISPERIVMRFFQAPNRRGEK